MSSNPKYDELQDVVGIVDDIRKSIAMISVYTRHLRERDKVLFESVCSSLSLHSTHLLQIVNSNMPEPPAEDPVP